MSEKRAGRELATWVAFTLAVPLELYVGAYYAMLDGIRRMDSTPYYSLHGNFYYQQDYTGDFFLPIHWLDRRIRREIAEHRGHLRLDHSGPLGHPADAKPSVGCCHFDGVRLGKRIRCHDRERGLRVAIP